MHRIVIENYSGPAHVPQYSIQCMERDGRTNAQRAAFDYPWSPNDANRFPKTSMKASSTYQRLHREQKDSAGTPILVMLDDRRFSYAQHAIASQS